VRIQGSVASVGRESGQEGADGGEVVNAVDTQSVVVAQILTFAIPIGALVLVILWGFFQRRPTE